MKIFATTAVGLYSLIQNSSIVQNLTLENIHFDNVSELGSIAARIDNSTVQNVTLLNPVIDGHGGSTIGGITGRGVGGTFKNILITNLSLRGGSNVGGAVGYSSAGIAPPQYEKVFVNGTINGGSFVGGITGFISGGGGLATMNQSRFTGSLSGSGSYIGGLAGISEYTRIESSYANAAFVTTAADTVYFGGLVGLAQSFVAGAGIHYSMVTGTNVSTCIAGISCAIDTVVGEQDGTYVVGDFSTTIYPTSRTISALSSSNLGTARPDIDFTTLPSPLAGTFPVSRWVFSTSFPKLQGEP